MIEFIDAPPSVFAFAAVGRVDRGDVEAVEAALERRLEAPGPVGLVADLSRVEDVTAGALAEDARFELGLIGRWRRLPFAAVISDRGWIRHAVRLAAPLAPGVEMRAFGADERDAAFAFAAQAGEGVEPPDPPEAVRPLETGDPGVHAWEIDGRITRADVARVSAPLAAAFERGETVNLLVRIKDYDGFDAAILTERALIALKLAALRHVDRYAIVGAKAWMERMASLMDPLIAPELRAFDPGDEDEAWSWVLKRDAPANG